MEEPIVRRLEAFQVEEAPKTGWRVWLKGSQKFADLLVANLYPAECFGPYRSRQSEFDHVMYV